MVMPDTCRIQFKNGATRIYPSGIPPPHGPPHETMPINCLFATNGPPESPVHTPWPLRENAQIVSL